MNQTIASLESILAEAVEIESTSERDSFLGKACDGNLDLRAEVERLLANHFKAGSFLERPAGLGATLPFTPLHEAPGTQIGPYKLLEQIGEGGMGLVYVAEQLHPVRRQVALKLIKPGMDSKLVIARFEAERQALALMDHPNIAKVLDAGTTNTGRPYFVMELVRGIPITEYCDQARFSIRQRLELFIQVCRAVQHAHTKGIIHRDIKPSNVLVTSHDGIPVPMVIDFGLVKALGQQLTEHTLHTGFAQMVGTPLYMSPEQAEFNQFGVDTRSDIYSLGVLLYELLTGVTPFDRSRLIAINFDEFRRILCEEEPPRPSTRLSTLEGAVLSTTSERRCIDSRKLSQTLHGELDWILLKSLDKDRNRRYETACAFATDVQRYLNNEAVEACPPSVGYRMRKFVRRNKIALAATSLVGLALVISTLLVWQERNKTQAAYLSEVEQGRRRAKTLRSALQALDEVYITVAEKRLPEKPKPDAADLELLEKALAFYEVFAEQNAADLEAWPELVRAYLRAGNIHEKLGQLQPAEQSYRRAIAAAEKNRDGPMTDNFRYNRSIVYDALGNLLRVCNRLPEAEQSSRKALELWEGLSKDRVTTTKYRVGLAYRLRNLATVLQFTDKSEETILDFDRAIILFQALAQELPNDVSIQSSLGATFHNRASLCLKLGNEAEAKKFLDQAIQHQQIAFKANPRNLEYREFLGNHYFVLGDVLAELKDSNAALLAYSQGIELHSELVRQFPGIREFQLNIIDDCKKLTWLLTLQAKPKEGLENCRMAAEIGERLVQYFPEEPQYCVVLIDTLSHWARICSISGQNKEAERIGRRSVSLAEKLVANFPNELDYKVRLGGEYCNLASNLNYKGTNLAETRRFAEQAIHHLNEVHKAAPTHLQCCEYLGKSYTIIGDILFDLQDYRGALAALESALPFNKSYAADQIAWLLLTSPEKELRNPRRAIELARQAVREDPSAGEYWMTLALAQYRLNEDEEAIKSANQTVKNGSHPPKHFTQVALCEAWIILSMAHSRLGDKEHARTWYDKAVQWIEKDKPKDTELYELQAEAADLLGLPKPEKKNGKK